MIVFLNAQRAVKGTVYPKIKKTASKFSSYLSFLRSCAVHLTVVSVCRCRKPTHTHTDQYLLFGSHHPLEHRLGVIQTLQHRAKEVPISTQAKKNEQETRQTALKPCGYPDWAFTKTPPRSETPAKKRREYLLVCSASYDLLIRPLSEQLTVCLVMMSRCRIMLSYEQ